MFEGLDDIDWKNVGIHVYGKNEKIPEAIRRLLSTDSRIRAEARDFLLGGGQDMGDVCDTTSYIIPFVFEILNTSTAPEKEILLRHLVYVIEDIKDAVNISIPMMRRYIATFDSFKANLGVLISLLNDENLIIRIETINLLQYWPDEQEVVLLEFEKRFGTEKDEQVLVVILKGMKILLNPFYDFHPVKKRYEQFASMILNTENSPLILLASSRLLAEAIYSHRMNVVKDETALKAVNLLSEEFLRISVLAEYHEWSEEFNEALMLIKDLTVFGLDHLLEIFQNPQISPLQSHLISMGLLAIMFVPSYMGDEFWKCSRSWDKNVTGVFYLRKSSSFLSSIQFSIKKEDRMDFDLRILETICENEKFWKIPTNMFSFFVGLPDTYDEMQKLLHPTK